MARGDQAPYLWRALMRLLWTRLASHDRKAIREYIAQDSPAAAIKLDELFVVTARDLLAQPHIGRPGRVAGTRELVAHPNYILIYDVADQAVVVRILRVLHAALPWPPQE